MDPGSVVEAILSSEEFWSLVATSPFADRVISAPEIILRTQNLALKCL